MAPKEHKLNTHALYAKWRQKLSQSGFLDLEDPKGNLKQPNTRSIAWQNQDRIRDFFIRLDHFMTHYKEMPKLDRKVMTDYSQGTQIILIAKKHNKSEMQIYHIIKRYKGIIQAIHLMSEI